MSINSVFSSILLGLLVSEASSYMVEPTSIEMLKYQVLASQGSLSAGAWHDVSSADEIRQAATSDFQRKQKQ